MSVFGNNIKKIRSVNRLSQQDFANLFGISRGSVGSYEEGRAEPKIETLISISKHFKISIDDLLKRQQHAIEKMPEPIEPIVEEQVDTPKDSNYIEDRVSRLEEKLQSIEDLIKAKNDNS